MAGERSSSSDSDSSSGDELQRLKEAVCEVSQIQPSSAADPSAGKTVASKSRLHSQRSARHDSEEEQQQQQGIGCEIGHDVQQFIAKKLAKFLDDTVEIWSPALAAAGHSPAADAAGSGQAAPTAASTVKIFSQSVDRNDEADNGDTAGTAAGARAASRRRRRQLQRGGAAGQPRPPRPSGGGSSDHSETGSSGSEEEPEQRLALESVAVTVDHVLREREVLHKYGVKRLGKLEVYRAATTSTSKAGGVATSASLPAFVVTGLPTADATVRGQRSEVLCPRAAQQAAAAAATPAEQGRLAAKKRKMKKERAL